MVQFGSVEIGSVEIRDYLSQLVTVENGQGRDWKSRDWRRHRCHPKPTRGAATANGKRNRFEMGWHFRTIARCNAHRRSTAGENRNFKNAAARRAGVGIEVQATSLNVGPKPQISGNSRPVFCEIESFNPTLSSAIRPVSSIANT